MVTRSSRFHSTPHLADVALARAARAGDREALERICKRLVFVPGLIAQILRRTDADFRQEAMRELVHETISEIWAKLDRFDGRGSLEGWVYGFCAKQVVKFHERKRRRSRTKYGYEADTVAASEESSAVDLEWIHAALLKLEPPDDEIVRLRHFDELDYAQIGARLGMVPNTVKTRYHRALLRLRGILASMRREEGK